MSTTCSTSSSTHLNNANSPQRQKQDFYNITMTFPFFLLFFPCWKGGRGWLEGLNYFSSMTKTPFLCKRALFFPAFKKIKKGN